MENINNIVTMLFFLDKALSFLLYMLYNTIVCPDSSKLFQREDKSIGCLIWIKEKIKDGKESYIF